jgi:hypothetical protein
MIKLTTIKSNPNNPRVIRDEKFKKLVKSIEEFPKMMALRPMVVNEDMVVLGGNMRLKALKELGYKEVPNDWVKSAKDLTDDEIRRFIIADNVGFGEHDWEMLANEWNVEELTDWGLDIPNFNAADIDYSILDDENIDSHLDDMADGVKKAIQIEFEAEHYEEASELVKFWREQKLYIGGFLMEKLKDEKAKL